MDRAGSDSTRRHNETARQINWRDDFTGALTCCDPAEPWKAAVLVFLQISTDTNSLCSQALFGELVEVPGFPKIPHWTSWSCNTGGGRRCREQRSAQSSEQTCKGCRSNVLIKQRPEHSQNTLQREDARLFVILSLKMIFQSLESYLGEYWTTRVLRVKRWGRNHLRAKPWVWSREWSIMFLLCTGLDLVKATGGPLCKTSNATVIPEAISIHCKHCKMPKAFTAWHKHESQGDAFHLFPRPLVTVVQSRGYGGRASVKRLQLLQRK